MEGRKLTLAQKDEIQGVFFDVDTFFSCAQDINYEWFVFLSHDNIQVLEGSQWQWVVDLSSSEYIPLPPPNIPPENP